MAHRKIKGSDLHLTVSKLSRMTAKDLRNLDHTRLVVTKKHETVAALIPYGQYLEMQAFMKGIYE